MPSKPITEDHWRAALEQAMRKPENASGVTTWQASRVWGVGVASARLRLQRLVREGKWKRVGQVYVEGLDGKQRPVPAYAPVKG